MSLTRPASITTVHADGLRTTSTRRRFAPRLTEKKPVDFISSDEFVGAEMPLNRSLRQLATNKFSGVNQSVMQRVN